MRPRWKMPLNSIRLHQILREEAVEVWKDYQARPDRLRY